MDEMPKLFEVTWIIVALYVGTFGTFFTDKFIELNAQWFEKMHTLTGSPTFKKQAETMREPHMWWLAKLIGAFFLVFSLLVLLGAIELN